MLPFPRVYDCFASSQAGVAASPRWQVTTGTESWQNLRTDVENSLAEVEQAIASFYTMVDRDQSQLLRKYTPLYSQLQRRTRDGLLQAPQPTPIGRT